MTSNETPSHPLTSPATPADGPVPLDDAVDPPSQYDGSIDARDHGAAPASAGTATTGSADAGSAVDPADAVWTASSLEHEPTARRVRTGTVTWGLILACLGGLLVALGLGARVDLVLTGIVLLAGLGVAIIILALLPRRTSPKAT